MRRMMLFLCVSLTPFFSVSGAYSAPPADADPALAPWFKSLQAPDTLIGCCDHTDCRGVASRYRHGHYEVQLNNSWIAVPEEKVIEGSDNPTPEAILCYSPHFGIMCFVPEPPS
jgi:hypothetical protein